MDENENDWDDFIDGALFAINTNVSSTTKFSSFTTFGCQTRLTFDVGKICAAGRKEDASVHTQDGYDKKCYGFPR